MNCYELIAFQSAEGRTTHTCKLVFNSREKKKSLLEKAKTLKEDEIFKTTFIKADLPPMTRKENYRLRCKKRELSQQHPDDEIKIVKGVLYHNMVQCDKFSLSNQLF